MKDYKSEIEKIILTNLAVSRTFDSAIGTSIIEKRVTQLELVKSRYPVNSLATLHLFLGRWDITEDWVYSYEDMATGDRVFVYKEKK